MSDAQDSNGLPPEEEVEQESRVERFPELAELQEKIDRRLRSNKRFLERFMDEDYDDLDEEDPDDLADDEEPEIDEEL